MTSCLYSSLLNLAEEKKTLSAADFVEMDGGQRKETPIAVPERAMGQAWVHRGVEPCYGDWTLHYSLMEVKRSLSLSWPPSGKAKCNNSDLYLPQKERVKNIVHFLSCI